MSGNIASCHHLGEEYFTHLLLLLSGFSRVRPCATPWTAAHQAPRPWDSPGKHIGVGAVSSSSRFHAWQFARFLGWCLSFLDL